MSGFRWSSPWIFALLVAIFIALWSDVGKPEGFQPSSRLLVMGVFDHLQKKNIVITKESITSIRIEDIHIGKPGKQGVMTQWVQGKKAYISRASGKPKFILANGSIIIDKPIHIEAQGETRGDAEASAKSAIDEIGKALADEARFRGLMVG